MLLRQPALRSRFRCTEEPPNVLGEVPELRFSRRHSTSGRSAAVTVCEDQENVGWGRPQAWSAATVRRPTLPLDRSGSSLSKIERQRDVENPVVLRKSDGNLDERHDGNSSVEYDAHSNHRETTGLAARLIDAA